MKTVWTKGLQEDAAKDVESSFTHSTLLRERLKHLLEEKKASEIKARYARDDYSEPNWTEKQADSIGYIRAISEIISLIS